MVDPMTTPAPPPDTCPELLDDLAAVIVALNSAGREAEMRPRLLRIGHALATLRESSDHHARLTEAERAYLDAIYAGPPYDAATEKLRDLLTLRAKDKTNG